MSRHTYVRAHQKQLSPCSHGAQLKEGVGSTTKNGDIYGSKKSRPRTAIAQCPFQAEFSSEQKGLPRLRRSCCQFVKKRTSRCGRCVCPATNKSCGVPASS